MTGPVLEVRAATLVVGSGELAATLVSGIDLAVAAGEMVCLVGPSGSGKSSLCHLAAGFERPTSGEVLLLGRPAHEVRDWRVVAAVPQQNGLVPELTVDETLALPVAIAARNARRDGSAPSALRDSAELADRLDLTAFRRRMVGQTSLGEQQRIAIARAMVTGPALVVLDEPTSHQDDDHVDIVVAAMRRAALDGSAVLVATHDNRVIRLADRVIRLEDGRIVG